MKDINSQQSASVGDVDEVISKLLEKVPPEQVRSLIAFAKFIESPPKNSAPKVRVLPKNVREIRSNMAIHNPA
ncbi:hypothetical protein P886_0377 [Alteromonadaceae bacterium 2753L.S.0a.02]|nr:hypothetical protein P886_0377 [Alteromonadaceae bacterium 2753L.S.0a.02]